jgi:hypothetical protein
MALIKKELPCAPNINIAFGYCAVIIYQKVHILLPTKE